MFVWSCLFLYGNWMEKEKTEKACALDGVKCVPSDFYLWPRAIEPKSEQITLTHVRFRQSGTCAAICLHVWHQENPRWQRVYVRKYNVSYRKDTLFGGGEGKVCRCKRRVEFLNYCWLWLERRLRSDKSFRWVIHIGKYWCLFRCENFWMLVNS